MTAAAGFLTRWSRLKRADPDRAPAAAPAPERPADAAGEPGLPGAARPSPAPMPPPQEMADAVRAALRRCWSQDETIRTYVGIAEAQWDFNEPGAIAGFGTLPDGFAAAALAAVFPGHVARAVDPAAAREMEDEAPPAEGPDEARRQLTLAPVWRHPGVVAGPRGTGALPAPSRAPGAPGRRAHGRALPR
ncbi:hypothetical protein [Salinarimonas soli]|uniref:DUF3306 domain-containing protein n=1 Tax=Salinarimonas soli TaxID=1638099 RepID=A0A5B2VDS0_9HYPH|nr:hypothetical protein [Salinarimonas soli]KAA2236580.1 hypothetical protein F0L46_13985 [Salinarimonas soli]